MNEEAARAIARRRRRKAKNTDDPSGVSTTMADSANPEIERSLTATERPNEDFDAKKKKKKKGRDGSDKSHHSNIDDPLESRKSSHRKTSKKEKKKSLSIDSKKKKDPPGKRKHLKKKKSKNKFDDADTTEAEGNPSKPTKQRSVSEQIPGIQKAAPPIDKKRESTSLRDISSGSRGSLSGRIDLSSVFGSESANEEYVPVWERTSRRNSPMGMDDLSLDQDDTILDDDLKKGEDGDGKYPYDKLQKKTQKQVARPQSDSDESDSDYESTDSEDELPEYMEKQKLFDQGSTKRKDLAQVAYIPPPKPKEEPPTKDEKTEEEKEAEEKAIAALPLWANARKSLKHTASPHLVVSPTSAVNEEAPKAPAEKVVKPGAPKKILPPWVKTKEQVEKEKKLEVPKKVLPPWVKTKEHVEKEKKPEVPKKVLPPWVKTKEPVEKEKVPELPKKVLPPWVKTEEPAQKEEKVPELPKKVLPPWVKAKETTTPGNTTNDNGVEKESDDKDNEQDASRAGLPAWAKLKKPLRTTGSLNKLIDSNDPVSASLEKDDNDKNVPPAKAADTKSNLPPKPAWAKPRQTSGGRSWQTPHSVDDQDDKDDTKKLPPWAKKNASGGKTPDKFIPLKSDGDAEDGHSSHDGGTEKQIEDAESATSTGGSVKDRLSIFGQSKMTRPPKAPSTRSVGKVQRRASESGSASVTSMESKGSQGTKDSHKNRMSTYLGNTSAGLSPPVTIKYDNDSGTDVRESQVPAWAKNRDANDNMKLSDEKLHTIMKKNAGTPRITSERRSSVRDRVNAWGASNNHVNVDASSVGTGDSRSIGDPEEAKPSKGVPVKVSVTDEPDQEETESSDYISPTTSGNETDIYGRNKAKTWSTTSSPVPAYAAGRITLKKVTADMKSPETKDRSNAPPLSRMYSIDNLKKSESQRKLKIDDAKPVKPDEEILESGILKLRKVDKTKKDVDVDSGEQNILHSPVLRKVERPNPEKWKTSVHDKTVDDLYSSQHKLLRPVTPLATEKGNVKDRECSLPKLSSDSFSDSSSVGSADEFASESGRNGDENHETEEDDGGDQRNEASILGDDTVAIEATKVEEDIETLEMTGDLDSKNVAQNEGAELKPEMSDANEQTSTNDSAKEDEKQPFAVAKVSDCGEGEVSAKDVHSDTEENTLERGISSEQSDSRQAASIATEEVDDGGEKVRTENDESTAQDDSIANVKEKEEDEESNQEVLEPATQKAERPLSDEDGVAEEEIEDINVQEIEPSKENAVSDSELVAQEDDSKHKGDEVANEIADMDVIVEEKEEVAQVLDATDETNNDQEAEIDCVDEHSSPALNNSKESGAEKSDDEANLENSTDVIDQPNDKMDGQNEDGQNEEEHSLMNHGIENSKPDENSAQIGDFVASAEEKDIALCINNEGIDDENIGVDVINDVEGSDHAEEKKKKQNSTIDESFDRENKSASDTINDSEDVETDDLTGDDSVELKDSKSDTQKAFETLQMLEKAGVLNEDKSGLSSPIKRTLNSAISSLPEENAKQAVSLSLFFSDKDNKTEDNGNKNDALRQTPPLSKGSAHSLSEHLRDSSGPKSEQNSDASSIDEESSGGWSDDDSATIKSEWTDVTYGTLGSAVVVDATAMTTNNDDATKKLRNMVAAKAAASKEDIIPGPPPSASQNGEILFTPSAGQSGGRSDGSSSGSEGGKKKAGKPDKKKKKKKSKNGNSKLDGSSTHSKKKKDKKKKKERKKMEAVEEDIVFDLNENADASEDEAIDRTKKKKKKKKRKDDAASNSGDDES